MIWVFVIGSTKLKSLSCTPIIPLQMETVHTRLCTNISWRHERVVWANGFDPMVATAAALTLLSQPTSWPHGEFPMTHPPREGSFDADQGSWPSPVYRNWLEARQETQAGLLWGHCYSSREPEQGTGSLAWLLPGRGWAGSLRRGRWGVSRDRTGGVACRWFVHSLDGIVCREHGQYPAFAPEVAVVFFGFFVSFV